MAAHRWASILDDRPDELVVAAVVPSWPAPDPMLLATEVAAAMDGNGAGRAVTVVLFGPGTVPTDADTARSWWHDGRDVVFEHRAPAVGAQPRDAAAIAAWLVDRCALILDVEPAAVDRDLPLADLGIDSMALAEAVGDFEAWLGGEVPPTIFWRHPTIAGLSEALATPDAEPMPTRVVACGPEPVEVPVGPGFGPGAVAVVGIGCRFPGVAGPDQLWQRLVAGESLLRPPPPTHPGATGPDGTSRRGAFLDDPLAFDASFFGLRPREAERIDPQQRLLLEVTWEAMEDAGIVPSSLAGTATGVYVGISQNDYQLLGARAYEAYDAHMLLGTAHCIAANRISYQFDLRGPSMAVDTACSSSLLAAHLACRSLRAGEASLAIVGGVNLLLFAAIDAAFDRAGMLAPGGRCRTFDAAAEGYVRGEGCGVVILRRLDDALAAGDRIYAVIAGSASVQDGRSNGITAPNVEAQASAIEGALADAGVPPSRLGYVEAHGTGTPMGDPIEIEALRGVLATDPPPAPCYVGSLKTNVGHLEAAAGIAGLIKAALVLHHRAIPRHLHLEQLNPLVDLGAELRVPDERATWPSATQTAAGVSSFGFGGTNVHVTLCGAPAREVASVLTVDPPVLLLSADDTAALARQATALAAHVATVESGDGLADVRATVNTRRRRGRVRAAVVGDDAATLAARLGDPVDATGSDGPPRLALVFAGQGASALRDLTLLRRLRPVDDRLEEADALVERPGGRRLLDWLGTADTALPTEVAQPLLYALSVGLAEVVAGLGVPIAAVTGHSVGEVAATTVAGGLDFHDGVAFVAERGRAMAAMPVGAMVAVLAPEDEVDALLAAGGPTLAVAGVNADRCTVVGGSPEDVERLTTEVLGPRRIAALPLASDRAFHTAAVDDVLARIRAGADRCRWQPTGLLLQSTLDGSPRAPGWVPDADHWVRHARRPVRFAEAVAGLRGRADTFVEIGFGAALSRWGRRLAPGTAWHPLLDEAGNPRSGLANLLAVLHGRGSDLDLDGLYPPGSVRVVSLPPHPFDRTRYWMPGQSLPEDEPADVTPPSSTPAPPPPPAVVDISPPAAGDLGIRLADAGFTRTTVDAAAVRLERQLRGFGVTAGDVVGLLDRATPELVVGLLALDRLGVTIRLLADPGHLDPAGPDPLRVIVAAGPIDGFAGECVVPALGDATVVDGSAPAGLRIAGEQVGLDGLARIRQALAQGGTIELDARSTSRVRRRPVVPSLSLAYFGCYPAEPARDKYRLILEAAGLADRLGFEAVWSPERHFDVFGGAFPAPAVLSAALAATTRSIAVRAGSVVVPLHHPITVAEEWALVDNLSGGRTGIAIASGWNDRDRLIAPDPDADPIELVARNLDLIRRLWSGDTIPMTTSAGTTHPIRLHPLPVQPSIPLWLTILRNPASWLRAAQLDLNVLTNLMGQSVDQLRTAITSYRGALADRGADPTGRRVTLLAHTHLGTDDAAARAEAAGPLADYLRSSVGLFVDAAQFPWVKEHLASLSSAEQEAEVATITALAQTRYLEGSALIGGADLVAERLGRLGDAGVDEVCCLVDFGVERVDVLAGIERLAELRDRLARPVPIDQRPSARTWPALTKPDPIGVGA